MGRSVVVLYLIAVWVFIAIVLIWYLGILSPVPHSPINHLLHVTAATQQQQQQQQPHGTHVSTDVWKETYRDENLLLKLCNKPKSFKAGIEGKLSASERLVGVIVIFRHGDRGPLIPVEKLEKLNCSKFATADHFALEKVLKTNNKIFDNSLRYPFSSFRGVPDGDQCRSGHLTRQGSSQLIQLGKILKNSYENHMSGSNKSLGLHNNIEAISTPYTRTFQSLRSFLYGFLDPGNFLNVSIANGFNVAFCQKNCKCPMSSHYDKRFKEELDSVQTLNRNLTNDVKKLSVLLQTSKKPDSKVNSNSIRDSLLAYICHGENPVSENSYLLTRFADYLSWEATTIKKRLKSWIALDSLESTGLNFTVYSGHDLTLMYLLHAFDSYDGFMPPYASRFVIELFADISSGYFVRFIWNGENVSQNVCGSLSCQWKKFTTFLKDQMRNLFLTNDIQKACEN